MLAYKEKKLIFFELTKRSEKKTISGLRYVNLGGLTNERSVKFPDLTPVSFIPAWGKEL